MILGFRGPINDQTNQRPDRPNDQLADRRATTARPITSYPSDVSTMERHSRKTWGRSSAEFSPDMTVYQGGRRDDPDRRYSRDRRDSRGGGFCLDRTGQVPPIGASAVLCQTTVAAFQ